MALSPFHGVNIFLHIRDHGDPGRDRTRHYAKKSIRKLGAALTLSEAAADIVVFHCGSASLLENMTARGKAVVSPEYLTACARRMERLPVDDFRIRPSTTGGEAEEWCAADKKQSGSSASSAGNGRRGGFVVVSQLPDFAEKDTNASLGLAAVPGTKTIAAVKANSSTVRSAGDEIESHEETSVPLLFDEKKETRNPERDVNEMETPRVVLERKRPYLLDDDDDDDSDNNDETPAISAPVAMHDGKKTRNGGVAVDSNAQQVKREKEASVGLSGAVTNKQRKRSRHIGDTGNAKSRGDTNSEGDEGHGELSSTMFSPDTQLLSPTCPQQSDAHEALSGDAPLRIAVSSEDSEVVQFLFDVVEQLGATAVPCVFGRVQKPTHLVVAGDGELTPMILMARALGIPVLAEQWLYDAIALGAFPNITEAHRHTIYGHVCGECEEEMTESGKPLRNSNKSMEDVLADILNDDIGPHYRPIFVGMTFAFVSRHSMHAHTEHFAEILRLLGAVVSRTTTSTQLTAIIDLGQNEKTHSLVPTVPNKRGPQSKSKLKNDATELETTVPVLSAEWIVQCILLGRATDMRPFVLTASESITCALDKNGTSARRRETRDSYAKNGAKGSLERPPVESVRSKTREGPSSAKKKAEHQLSTQQLLEE